MKISFNLGNIKVGDFQIKMSGLRWLCKDGQYCKGGVPIAYCNVQLLKENMPLDMSGEEHDFQAIFIAPVDGVIHIRQGTSYGGLIDQLPHFFFWDPQFIICEVEIEGWDQPPMTLQVQVVFATGKRYLGASENRTGVLSGWFQRTRAWVADRGPIHNTIITLGICDILNGLRGSEIIPLDLMRLIPDSTQVILFQDTVLIPTVTMMLDQVKRTPENSSKIIINFKEMIKNSSQIFEPEDYLFLGAILKSLVNNSFLDSTLTISRSGIDENTRPNIVLTSLAAQPKRLFRHKTLGYSISCHDFRFRQMGNAARIWLQENFHLVTREANEIGQELRELANLLGPDTRLLVCNISANPLSAFIPHYDLFDQATFKEIAYVNQREMNVMLDGLASEGILEVVDLNLLSAQMGTLRHVPDGIHMSGVLEQEFIKELAYIISKK